MAQMNVSITHKIEKFVRKSVKSGRYNNASEVVREALRRMELEDAKVARVGKPSVDDILADLTAEQVETIRKRVIHGIESLDGGKFTEYTGRAGLKKLSGEIKAGGRRLLAERNSRR